jgi:hypothetical protein
VEAVALAKAKLAVIPKEVEPSKAEKAALTKAATALKQYQTRAREADDLRALFLVQLAVWVRLPSSASRLAGAFANSKSSKLQEHVISRERVLAVAQRLKDAVMDESIPFLTVDAADYSARNSKLLQAMPIDLASICMYCTGGADSSLGDELMTLLADVISQLAQRVLSISLGERELRHAVFVRLTTLHEKIPHLTREDPLQDPQDMAEIVKKASELLREALSEHQTAQHY